MRPWGGIDRGKELGKHVNTSRIHDKGTTCIVKKVILGTTKSIL